jgi:hypothetical protein
VDCGTRPAADRCASCTKVHASRAKATIMPSREITIPESNATRSIVRARALRFRQSHWTNVSWLALSAVLSIRRYGPASVTVVDFRCRVVSEVGKISRGLWAVGYKRCMMCIDDHKPRKRREKVSGVIHMVVWRYPCWLTLT